MRLVVTKKEYEELKFLIQDKGGNDDLLKGILDTILFGLKIEKEEENEQNRL